MATLLFFDDAHRYQLDGEDLPSVSELCRFLSREVYSDISQYRLDNAAERGTKVHKACQALDLYGKIEVEDDILPYVQAYLRFRQEHAVKWDSIETATHHKTLKYAGTIDRCGKVDNIPCVVDLKTSYTVHKPLALAQLNLYRMMLEQDGDWTAEALYILHLKKDATYRLIPFDRNDEVPSSLLTLHQLMQKKGRSKNGRSK